MAGQYQCHSYPVAIERSELLSLWASGVDGVPLVVSELTAHDAKKLWDRAATWVWRKSMKQAEWDKEGRLQTVVEVRRRLVKREIHPISLEIKATLTPCGLIWKYISLGTMVAMDNISYANMMGNTSITWCYLLYKVTFRLLYSKVQWWVGDPFRVYANPQIN